MGGGTIYRASDVGRRVRLGAITGALSLTLLLVSLGCTGVEALEPSGEADAQPSPMVVDVIPWDTKLRVPNPPRAAAPEPEPAPPPAPQPAPEPIPVPAPEPQPLVLKLRAAEQSDGGFGGCDFELGIEGLPAAREDGLVAHVMTFQPPLSSLVSAGVIVEQAHAPEQLGPRTELGAAKLMLFDGDELELAEAKDHTRRCKQLREKIEAELATIAEPLAGNWRPMQRLPVQIWNTTHEPERDREEFSAMPARERPVQLVTGGHPLIARVMGVSVYFEHELHNREFIVVEEAWVEPYTNTGLITLSEIAPAHTCDCTCDWFPSSLAVVWPEALVERARERPCVETVEQGSGEEPFCNRVHRW